MRIGWQMRYDADKAISQTKTVGTPHACDEYAIRNS